jgi:glycosyltransferase involved in cell wall biosynthesis
MDPAPRPLIIIPCYNPGRNLPDTVALALASSVPVWVVDDASTDGSPDRLRETLGHPPSLRLLSRPQNGGKGAAVLTAAEEALKEGYTHALVLDADGQHPAGRIPEFLEASRLNPKALVAGLPVFGPEAPRLRLYGRKLSILMVWLELGGPRLKDPLFGFRVYPLAPLAKVMRSTRGGRRYDFDPEFGVRLGWAGVPIINLPAECRYIPREEGGVSHFHYLRDNVRMVALHTRLILELLLIRWWRS